MHYAPCFVLPCGPSTLYRCSLTTLAQDKPYHKKPLIRDSFNLKVSCRPTLFRPYPSTAAGITSSSFVRVSTRQLTVSFLSKRISSTLNFHERRGHWYWHDWRDSNSQPLAPHASTVSIQLPWLTIFDINNPSPPPLKIVPQSVLSNASLPQKIRYH